MIGIPVLQKRKQVIIITLLIAVLCLILIPQVTIISPTAPSTIALNVILPNARIMVPDITIPEALELKKQFAAVDGVEELTWLDDAGRTIRNPRQRYR